MTNQQHINQIKQFNRFYTRVMGIFKDKSEYTATEAMVLYEIKNKERCTAAYLTEYFDLDKSTISKVIKKLTNKKLLGKSIAEEDKRMHILHLTFLGEEVLNQLLARASHVVDQVIKPIPEDEMKKLLQAMSQIEEILQKNIKIEGD